MIEALMGIPVAHYLYISLGAFIIFIVGACAAAYKLGKKERHIDQEDFIFIPFIGICVAIMWPLVLVLAAASALLLTFFYWGSKNPF